MDVVYMPFAQLLRFLSELFDSYGYALIALGLVITVIRIPFDFKSKRGTMKTSLIQPKMKAIQEKYAGNSAKINQELQKLYQQENVKPLGGCIWMAFPMVIILILFGIIRQPLTHLMGLDQYQIDALRLALEGLGVTIGTGALYQVEMAGHIRPYFEQLHAVVPQIFNLNMNFLGLDIGQTPDWRHIFAPWEMTGQDLGLIMLPVLSMVSAYASQKMMMATSYMPQMSQPQIMKTMIIMMPFMSLFIGFTFPAAMSLYWTVSSLSFALASVFTNKHFKKIFDEMKAEMDAREQARQVELDAKLEAKRKRTEELRAQGATQENKGTSKKKKHLQEREKERQRQADNRAALREEEEGEENESPSQVGHRKFARGRAYEAERYEGLADDEEDGDLDFDETEDFSETAALLEEGEAEDSTDEDFTGDDSDYDEEDDYDYDDEDNYDDEKK